MSPGILSIAVVGWTIGAGAWLLSRHVLRRHVVLAALGGMVVALGPAAGRGAELAPYAPPNAPMQQERSPTQQPSSAAPTNADVVRFREAIKKLNPEQRATLAASFRAKQNAALRDARVDEAQYYRRLLDVLEEH